MHDAGKRFDISVCGCWKRVLTASQPETNDDDSELRFLWGEAEQASCCVRNRKKRMNTGFRTRHQFGSGPVVEVHTAEEDRLWPENKASHQTSSATTSRYNLFTVRIKRVRAAVTAVVFHLCCLDPETRTELSREPGTDRPTDRPVLSCISSHSRGFVVARRPTALYGFGLHWSAVPCQAFAVHRLPAHGSHSLAPLS